MNYKFFLKNVLLTCARVFVNYSSEYMGKQKKKSAAKKSSKRPKEKNIHKKKALISRIKTVLNATNFIGNKLVADGIWEQYSGYNIAEYLVRHTVNTAVTLNNLRQTWAMVKHNFKIFSQGLLLEYR